MGGNRGGQAGLGRGPLDHDQKQSRQQVVRKNGCVAPDVKGQVRERCNDRTWGHTTLLSHHNDPPTPLPYDMPADSMSLSQSFSVNAACKEERENCKF